MKKLFSVFIILFIFLIINTASAQTIDKKIAISAGVGITYPMGEMSNIVNFPMIPLLVSFQYAVLPHLTLEGDSYYYLYANTEKEYSGYESYQFGIGARFWLTTQLKQGNIYNGMYLGFGLAKTNVEYKYNISLPSPGNSEKDKKDRNYSTLVLKGGYIKPLENTLLDIGLRYDIVDVHFNELFDNGLTLYAMAMFLF